MSRGVSLGWVLLIGCWGRVSLAEGPDQGTCSAPAPPTCYPESLLSGCPDDYCRKPCPWIHHLPPCGLVDDYCRKPLPWIWRLEGCRQPDDYCRKPCPKLCRPLCPDHYSCGKACVPQTTPIPARSASEGTAAPLSSVGVVRQEQRPEWPGGGIPAMVQERSVPAPLLGQTISTWPRSPYQQRKENP